MKELIKNVVSAGKLLFKALDLLDMFALFALACMVLVAIPYGIIKLSIERGQFMLAIVISIILLISAIALFIHFQNRRKTGR